MNLDFRNCKTAEDVKKVFDKNKDSLTIVKKTMKDLLNTRRNRDG